MNFTIKDLFKKRLLFLSEKHSFTGGAIQTIKERFPDLPLKLLLLDVHFDVFNLPKKERPEIHEGNFLIHLLKHDILKEEEIFLVSVDSSINFELPSGYYYLSWDIDYGLSHFARYPSFKKQSLEKTKHQLETLFRELMKRDKMIVAMDIVELDHRKATTPLQVALVMSSFVDYFFFSYH